MLLTGSPGDPFSPGLPGKPCERRQSQKEEELSFGPTINQSVTVFDWLHD